MKEINLSALDDLEGELLLSPVGARSGRETRLKGEERTHGKEFRQRNNLLIEGIRDQSSGEADKAFTS